jgi:hypothetical protein
MFEKLGERKTTFANSVEIIFIIGNIFPWRHAIIPGHAGAFSFVNSGVLALAVLHASAASPRGVTK